MADLCLVSGFLIGLAGVFILAGAGWACLVAGAVLFIAGGMASGKRPS